MMFEALRYRVTAEINRKSNEMVLGVVRDILTEHGHEAVYEINEKAVIKAFEALEKQIPKKVEYGIDGSWGVEKGQPVCPVCDYFITRTQFIGEGKKVTYCEHCGQAIDWSD